MNLIYYIPDAAGTCPAAKGKSDSSISFNPRHEPVRTLVPCSNAQGNNSCAERSRAYICVKARYTERNEHNRLAEEMPCHGWQHNMLGIVQNRHSPLFNGQLTTVRHHAIHLWKRHLHNFMQASSKMIEQCCHKDCGPKFPSRSRPKGLELGLRVHTYLLNALQQATESFQYRPSHNYVPFLGIALTENVLAMTVS
jgi:hypothetical protein